MLRRPVIGRGGWRVGKGGERESGQLHGFHSLTADGSVLKVLLFIVFLYKQFDYDSLKCDSIKSFFTINID